MIDFKEELAKYKPIMQVKDVEEAAKSDDLQDLFDLLKYVAGKGGK